jgi:TP901 family phage tail tape measure protein
MAEEVGKLIYTVEADTKKSTTSLKSIQKKFKELSDEVKKLQKNVETNTEQIESSLKEVDAAAKKVKKSFADIKVSAKGLDSLGDSALNLSKKVVRLGLAIGAAGIAAETFAVKQAIDFETAFAGVRKTVEASEEQFAQLRQELRDLANIKPVDINELARIEELGGQLGIATENLTAFTDTIAQLTVTTDLTAESASKDFARIFNVTRESQANFERFGSTIVDLGNNFATTESEIVALTNRLAPTATLIGISTANTAGLAAAMSSLGVPAELGGTAFQRLGMNIFQATQQGGDALERFASVAGMTAEEFRKAFEDDAAQAISTFLGGIGTMVEQGGDVVSVLDSMQLGDVRLARTVLALAGNTDLLNNALNTSSRAWELNNALSVEAEKRFSTTESKIKVLQNRIRDVAITIGDKLLPVVNEKIQQFTDFLDENSEELDQFVGDAVAFGEALINGIGEGAKIAVEALRFLRDNADELGNALKSGALTLGLIVVIGKFEKLRLLLIGGGGITAGFIALAAAVGIVTKEYFDLQSITKDGIDQATAYRDANLKLADSFQAIANKSKGSVKEVNEALSDFEKSQAAINDLQIKRQEILANTNFFTAMEDQFGAIETSREKELKGIDKQIEELSRLQNVYYEQAQSAQARVEVELEGQQEILKDTVQLAKVRADIGEDEFNKRISFIKGLKINNDDLNRQILNGDLELSDQRKKLIDELEITNVSFLNKTKELDKDVFDTRIQLAQEYGITSETQIGKLLSINQLASLKEVEIRAKGFVAQQKLATNFYVKLAELRANLLADPSIAGLKQFASEAKGLVKLFQEDSRKISSQMADTIKSSNDQMTVEQDNLADMFNKAEEARKQAEEDEKKRAEELQNKFDAAQKGVVNSIETFVRENGQAQEKVREDINKTTEEIKALEDAYNLEKLQAKMEFQEDAADIILEAEREILEIEKQIQELRQGDDSFEKTIKRIDKLLKRAQDGLKESEDQLNEINQNIQESITDFAKSITTEIQGINDEIKTTIESIDDLTNEFNSKTLEERMSFQEDATKIVIGALDEIEKLQAEIAKGKNDVNVSADDIKELEKRLDEQLEIIQYNEDQQIVSAEQIAAAQEESQLSSLEALQERYEEEEKARKEAFQSEIAQLEEQKAAYESQLAELEIEQSSFYSHLELLGGDYTRIYDEQVQERERITIDGLDGLIEQQQEAEREVSDSERRITRLQRQLKKAERDQERAEHDEKIAELQAELEEQLRVIRTNESEQIVSKEYLATRRDEFNLDELTKLTEKYTAEKTERDAAFLDELGKLEEIKEENIDKLVDLERANATYYAILKKQGEEFTGTYELELKKREEDFAQSLLRQIEAYKKAQGLLRNAQSGNNALAGFTSGGFTGGGVASVAGVVHGGEYVAPAWMVNSMRPLFESLESMRGRGYSEGGMVTNNHSRNVTNNLHATINNEVKLRTVLQEMSITLGR